MFKKGITLILAGLIATSAVVPVYSAPVGYVTLRALDAVDTTAKEDIFRLKDVSDSFIMLDHDEEGFFVTTVKFYGTHVYDPDLDGKFDIEKKNNIAYWLNNEFLNEGSSKDDGVDTITFSLPQSIKEHLVEHDWICEAGHPSSDFNEDYTVRAKIALMSVTEWKKYYSKIGLRDDTSSNYYWLRSVNGTAADSPAMVVATGIGITAFGKMYNAYGIRPVFYLDNNFFLDEKLEINALGANAAKIIRDAYSKEQLEKVYNTEEIEKMYAEAQPQASGVRMTGIQQVGQTLVASYNYKQADGVKEGNTDIRWLRSKEKNGMYSVIYGANGSEYTLSPNDAGYYIKCEVVPKSINMIGTAVRSDATISTVRAAHSPYATDVYIDGKAAVGEKLIARYFYFDDDDDIESGTVIQWQASADGENFEDIPGANGVNYIVEPEYTGKYLRFTVQVRNESYDGVGATVVSDKTNIVYSYPEAEKPQISLNGNVVTLNTAVSNEDLICWEIMSGANGFIMSKVGGNSYNLNGSETAVRASIIPVSGGYIGKRVYSDKLELQGAEQNVTAKLSTQISGNKKLIIKPAKADMAYSLDIKLSLNGVKINSVVSDDYQVIENISENTAHFILTKKALEGALISDKVIELDVSGNGTVEIISVSGVNKIDSGEYVSSEPVLSIE